MSMSRSLVLDAPMARLVPRARSGVALTPRDPVAPPKPAAPCVDVEAIRREAFAEGEKKARQELELLQQKGAEAVKTLESRIDSYLEKFEHYANEQIIALSVRMAEVLVRHALPDTEMLCALLKEATDKISDFKSIKVRTHPEASRLLGAELERTNPDALRRIEMIADPALTPGDLILENGFGMFDACLSQRLELLKQSLVERYRRAHANGNTKPDTIEQSA